MAEVEAAEEMVALVVVEVVRGTGVDLAGEMEAVKEVGAGMDKRHRNLPSALVQGHSSTCTPHSIPGIQPPSFCRQKSICCTEDRAAGH